MVTKRKYTDVKKKKAPDTGDTDIVSPVSSKPLINPEKNSAPVAPKKNSVEETKEESKLKPKPRKSVAGKKIAQPKEALQPQAEPVERSKKDQSTPSKGYNPAPYKDLPLSFQGEELKKNETQSEDDVQESSLEDEVQQEVKASKKATSKKPKKRCWPWVVISVILLLAFSAVALFSWDRWFRYDDALDFKGEWFSNGTDAVVVIDGQHLKLTEDVAYEYVLDEIAKTITFTFGNMEGEGRYRFSLDRSQLVITDGSGYSWFSTLQEDLDWMIEQLIRSIQDLPAQELLPADNLTILDRLSHNDQALPRAGSGVIDEGTVVSQEDSAQASDAQEDPAQDASLEIGDVQDSSFLSEPSTDSQAASEENSLDAASESVESGEPETSASE